jgi:hypothetical protein
MAITALRNGSCSTGVVAEDLEVEEGLEPLVADDLEELVLLEEFDDAGKSSKRNKVVECRREDTYSRILVVGVEGQPPGPRRCNLLGGTQPQSIGSLNCCRHK